jgi:hypothetical protein
MREDVVFEDILIEQNPHWVGNLYEEGIVRSYLAKLLQYLTTQMIVSIIGVRRAGKSTLLKQLINNLILQQKVHPQNILFLNLEQPYFSPYAKDVRYLQKIYEEYLKIMDPQGTHYVILDEVQFFKDWPIFVKALYEKKKIKFILTGSNSTLLSDELATLLSGRTLALEVFPLSFQELARANNLTISTSVTISSNRHKLAALLDRFLKFGGFPEVAFNADTSLAYDILGAYAKTILYQDVAPRLQLRKSVELERLFVYLISNIGKPYSYANLSEVFDLSDKAIKEYVTAYSDSYLLFELEMFDFSLKKQMRNPKKIFSIDPGQVNSVAFLFSENLGRLLENAVFLELRRHGLEVYYYKTKNNLEIDFLAKKNLQISLVQVSWHMQKVETRARELKALFVGLEELQLNNGLLITYDTKEEIREKNKYIHVIPAYEFFSLDQASQMELLQID